MRRIFSALLIVCLLAGCGMASPAETVPAQTDKTDEGIILPQGNFVWYECVIHIVDVSLQCPVKCVIFVPVVTQNLPRRHKGIGENNQQGQNIDQRRGLQHRQDNPSGGFFSKCHGQPSFKSVRRSSRKKPRISRVISSTIRNAAAVRFW